MLIIPSTSVSFTIRIIVLLLYLIKTASISSSQFKKILKYMTNIPELFKGCHLRELKYFLPFSYLFEKAFVSNISIAFKMSRFIGIYIAGVENGRSWVADGGSMLLTYVWCVSSERSEQYYAL